MAEESSLDKGKGPAKDDEMDPKEVERILRSLGLTEQIPGAIAGGKKQKEMSKYKFWQTQPVPSFEEARKAVEQEGPIKDVDKSKVSKDPDVLRIEGFEWCLLDLNNDKELGELYDLLSNHYVEDDESQFRFNYSKTFFNWALKAPGWQKTWHIGIRAIKSKKLVASIFGIAIDLRVRQKTFRSGDVNYLCVHKKLRGHRLAPILIKEITRRFNLEGIYQAIYTAGIVVPSPVSTCRYYHRTIDFEKLFEVGFASLPPGTSQVRQRLKYKLPAGFTLPGFRDMTEKDIVPVGELLSKYLERFDMAQVFSAEEIDHWFLHRGGYKSEDERVIWAYVVEDDKGKITDFISYYNLDSTIIKQKGHKHKVIRAAYLFYYATDVAFEENTDQKKLKDRLNVLVKDVLVMAKKNKFDVLNALTLMDNPLFLEEQKFGAGDGQLHYYLFNYRCSPVPGGVDAKNNLSVKDMGGVGMVML